MKKWVINTFIKEAAPTVEGGEITGTDGITGSNGEIINVSEEGTGNFTAEGESLAGDMVAEEGSTLNATLRGTEKKRAS